MRFLIAAAAATFFLFGCGPAAETGPIEAVENAWVRLPAVDGRPAAAYFTLHGGEAGDTLLAIDSDRVATIELHETIMEGRAMRMRPIMSTDMPPEETVEFEPGGRHAMLFGIDPEITPGTSLSLNFRFDSGQDVSIEAVTISAGEEPPFGSDEANGTH